MFLTDILPPYKDQIIQRSHDLCIDSIILPFNDKSLWNHDFILVRSMEINWDFLYYNL